MPLKLYNNSMDQYQQTTPQHFKENKILKKTVKMTQDNNQRNTTPSESRTGTKKPT